MGEPSGGGSRFARQTAPRLVVPEPDLAPPISIAIRGHLPSIAPSPASASKQQPSIGDTLHMVALAKLHSALQAACKGLASTLGGSVTCSSAAGAAPCVRSFSTAAVAAQQPPDVLIVGAGHNGLVAANLLARQGLTVQVVEEKGMVGGACRTEFPFGKAPGLPQSTGERDGASSWAGALAQPPPAARPHPAAPLLPCRRRRLPAGSHAARAAPAAVTRPAAAASRPPLLPALAGGGRRQAPAAGRRRGGEQSPVPPLLLRGVRLPLEEDESCLTSAAQLPLPARIDAAPPLSLALLSLALRRRTGRRTAR